MVFPDLPPPGPTSPVTVECVQQAAATYGIPEALMLAVLETEGGQPGLARRNRDGSHDLGPMQVNTRWVRREGLKPANCATTVATTSTSGPPSWRGSCARRRISPPGWATTTAGRLATTSVISGRSFGR